MNEEQRSEESSGPDALQPTPEAGEEEQKGELSPDDLNAMIELLCTSKAEEFRMLGYEQVTGADVWNCVSSKYKQQLPPMHRLVNDILSLRANRFMNWLMTSAYTDTTV